MAKTKTEYVCQECGATTPRWMGKCPSCGTWGSLVEEIIEKPSSSKGASRKVPGQSRARVLPLSEVELTEEFRWKTGVEELDRVLGGGILPGAFILLAGDPGIGKSTLMTELGKYLPGRKILYVTGEESPRQVKLRAQRLGVNTADMLLLAETNVDAITVAVQQTEPDLLIVDSIQTLYRPEIASAPGSVSQVRESAAAIQSLAKSLDLPVFLVGHVTKAGSIAGPRVLEHMVDTVLHIEGDRHHAYRILRAVKNRFGAANEIGVFEMRSDGMREVLNPSEIFLSDRRFGTSGSTVICSVEGTRPILVEVQALVTPTSYGTPQRTGTGFDTRRLQMLLAVLEKREGLKVSTHDVFLNLAGGVRLEEPAVDLGVLVAVASSFRDVPSDTGSVLVGEVGLGGEVRAVTHLGPRLKEIAKLGFEHAVVPKRGLDGLDLPKGLKVTGVERLHDVLDLVL